MTQTVKNSAGTEADVSVVVTKNAEGRVTEAKANMNLTVYKVGDIQISSSALRWHWRKLWELGLSW